MISKKNTLFPHYFRNQVYKVEWGPIEGNKNNLGLYVLAEGKMAVYDITQPNEGKTSILNFTLLYLLFKTLYSWSSPKSCTFISLRGSQILLCC
jgi:hypothetical protein